MRELPQSFWDQLDETPTRRAGGFIVGIETQPAGARCEFRRNPATEARFQYLKLLAALLEKEERHER